MQIRTATSADLAAVVQIEAECFPAAEAATELSLARRLALYPNHFWVLMDGKQLVGFVNGMATDEPDLRDEMYDDAALHNENGAWQMIFGVDTIPAYRRRGCAAMLLEHVIAEAPSGPQGACADLQGPSCTLLRQVRLCQRGYFRLHPR